ncbi:hypothetical protein GGR54DRAFT_138239 [Hypoxylon sp. NC1633]|nr:hypothetical protein GGR54DRAFT_138239 [Hypoxylon sp. NC1633]
MICICRDEGWGYRFEIYNIAFWATDSGRKLHDGENGCGAITGWDWHSATPSSYPLVYFNIDFFIKAGCIERAIGSAGGPKIACDGQGLGSKKRNVAIGGSGRDGAPLKSAERDKRAVVTVPASYLPPSSTPTYTHAASQTSTPVYVPMTWSGTDGKPVVLTSTIVSETAVVFTKVVPILPTMTNVVSATTTA